MSVYIKAMINAYHLKSNDTSICFICNYEYLTLSDIEYIVRYFYEKRYNIHNKVYEKIMDTICAHKLVTMEWMEEHSYIDWSKYDIILENPNITTETVEKYPEFNWKWENMHKIKNLNEEFIERNIDNKWNWDELSEHKAISLDFFLKHSEEPWSNFYLSCNPNITPSEVIEHPEIEWNHRQLYYNMVVKRGVLDLDTILTQVSENNELFVQIFKEYIKRVVNDDKLDELIKKMEELSDNNDKIKYIKHWFFQQPKYIKYMFKKEPYLNPEKINRTLLELFSIQSINEKVEKYYDKLKQEKEL